MPPGRSIILIPFLLATALAGCASPRMAELDARLGLAPQAAPPRQPAAAPGQEAALAGLYQEGAAALQGNDLDAAMSAWRRYAALAPSHLPRTQTVRGYLTLLERESAKRFAREAVAAERTAGRLKTDRFHVALIPFRNQDPSPEAKAKPFNRGIQAMVATDLAQVPSLKVLERARMDYLLREMRLAESGLVDPASAARAGRMLGAGSLVAGVVSNEADSQASPLGNDTGRYAITTAVSDVESGSLLGTQEARGRQYQYFELEKKIVHGILDALGVRDIPPAVDRIHTRNWDAYVRFTRGLRLLEEERFEEARQAFYAALNFDPEFALAEEAYLNTPRRNLGLEEIKAEVTSGR